MSTWSGKACVDCNRKKGPKQRTNKRCWTCQRLFNKNQSLDAHGKYLEEQYGITREDYDDLYAFQGGKCYLCRIATGKSRRLSVDHDHRCPSTTEHSPKTGCPVCVRGLLCRPDNNLLGVARDSVTYFIRAMQYLIEPPWQKMRHGDDEVFQMRRREIARELLEGSEEGQWLLSLVQELSAGKQQDEGRGSDGRSA